MIGRISRLLPLAAAAALALSAAAPAAHAAPPPLRRIGVDERPGQRIPLDLRFTDGRGQPVALADLVSGDLPVLLVLAYARCSMLCSLVLDGVTAAVRDLALEPGRDYRPIVVSLDPRETSAEADTRQATLLSRIGRAGEPWRWPYLVGDEPSIAALAAALGFRYAWDPATEQYAHPAVVFVLTPDGRIARYLYGIQYPTAALEAALRQAAAGVATTSTAAADLLRCFRFDPTMQRYRAQIQTYFHIGAAILFALLASLIVALFVWERRRDR